MNNKHPNRIDQSLSQFIIDFVNVSTFSGFMLPLLQVDTTSIKNLTQIHKQTINDNSQIGNQLNFKSQQMLNFYKEVQNQYAEFQNTIACKNKRKLINSPNKHKSQSKNIIKSQQKEIRTKLINQNQNNQNVNLANLQNKHILNNNKSNQEQKSHLYTDLKQIIRPQYRKQIGSKSYREQVNSLNCNQLLTKTNQKVTLMQRAKPKYQYIQTSEQCEEIIPNINRSKYNQFGIKDKQRLQNSSRSVSPKVERCKKIQKNQTNSISQISGNVQTCSDLSFQIDLNSMGIFSNELSVADSRYNRKNRENYTSSGNQHYKKQIKRLNNKSSKNRTNYIEEEEPWECDEEQIQDQIRQLNERLTNGHYRYQTEIQEQIQTDPIKFQSVPLSNHQTFRQTKCKEVKTVRLSLTPNKKKEVSHRKIQPKHEQPKGRRVTYKDYPIAKFPQAKKPQKYKQDSYIVQRQPDQSQQIQCAKWNRPKQGTIKVDIQRYIKQK